MLDHEPTRKSVLFGLEILRAIIAMLAGFLGGGN